MKLTDLNPHWVGAGGEGITNKDGTPAEERFGVGISLDCPCGKCESANRLYVPFRNPLDGKPYPHNDGHALWDRTGDTFETLSTTPSIQRRKDVWGYGCDWHGYITNGEIVMA
jgi:hypothetical protein